MDVTIRHSPSFAVARCALAGGEALKAESGAMMASSHGVEIEAKIAAADGRVATLLKAKKSPDEIIGELYLATVSRRPTAEELSACKSLMTGDPATSYQDLLWTLLNTKGFQFVR